MLFCIQVRIVIDAENIARQFQALTGKLYDNVEVKLLTQANSNYITHAEVENILQQQAARTKPPGKPPKVAAPTTNAELKDARAEWIFPALTPY